MDKNIEYIVNVSGSFNTTRTHILSFEKGSDAYAARDSILEAKITHERYRPNDPESKFKSFKHDLGEITLRVNELDTIHVFKVAEADRIHEKQRELDAKNTGEVIARTVAEILKNDK